MLKGLMNPCRHLPDFGIWRIFTEDRTMLSPQPQKGQIVAFVDFDFRFHFRLVCSGFVLDFRTDSCHAALVEALLA
jgi:hypothetical protein